MTAADTAHKKIPAKICLGKMATGQQVLDTEVKLVHTGIRMAAYNAAMTITREILTAAKTCYPGTALVLRYEVKTVPDIHSDYLTVRSPELAAVAAKTTIDGRSI